MWARTFESGGAVLGVRLAIGLLQGVLLCALFKAADLKAWPATDARIIAPLVLVGLFVPLLALTAWPALRPRTLLLWLGGATAVLVGIALHDLTWSGGEAAEPSGRAPFGIFFAAVGLFIAQALITAGDRERQYIASYPACFDAAWKQGVQVVLTIAFVGAFWIIVWLGTALFGLIGLSAFEDMIGEAWFWIVATTLAIAAALHITDVQPAIVRGIRTLKLTLLSWLLPVLLVIVAVFLASLPFTGLAPLWETRIGTPILLAVEAGLILLINAAYQDGAPERAAPGLLRFAIPLAALMLLPLAAISVYGLVLRVLQHGWTADRVSAAAAIGLVSLYALGYAFAIARSGLRMKELEITNLAAALATLALLFALFTPIADPARLSVAAQVKRLESGRVAPQAFDFDYLRFEGGRYGRAALDRLKANASGEHAAFIRAEIDAVLKRQYAGEGKTQAAATVFSRAAIVANISMRPAGRSLPDSFPLPGPESFDGEPLRCLREESFPCDGLFIDLDGDGIEEILLVPSSGAWRSVVFTEAGGTWKVGGLIDIQPSCPSVLEGLLKGEGRIVTPRWRDIEVGGRRLTVNPPEASGTCP